MPTLTLEAVLDLAAAAPLRASLLAHRGQDLDLDGALVRRVGGQCLQVLLSAERTWRADGRTLRLRNPSQPCREALALMQAGPLLGAEE